MTPEETEISGLFTDSALRRVTDAVSRHGKSRVAAVAGIGESSIRQAGRPGWNPTSGVLRALENAALALSERASGTASDEGGQDHAAQPAPARTAPHPESAPQIPHGSEA